MTLPKFTVPKGPDAKVQPDSNKPSEKAVDWIYNAYQRTKQQRGRDERKWSYHLTMISGNQYLRQQGFGDRMRLVTPPLQKGRVRSVTNLTRRLVRAEQSFYTSQSPSASVIPSSGEQEDLSSAKAGEQVWESYYSRKKLKQLWIRNSFWYVATGNAFFKTCWDNDIIPKDQNAIYNFDGTQMALPPQGDIDIKMVTPFHLFFPDLLEPEIEDQEFVIQAYTKPMEWAHARKLNIKADCVLTNEILNSVYFNESANQDAKPDSVLVLEAWIKPGSVAEYPDGGMITVAGKEVVSFASADQMYSHGEYPYAHAKEIETGKFYGASVLEDAIPLQREYNAVRSQSIEHRQQMSRAQWWVQEGSVDVSKMNSRTGLVNEYKLGFQPPTPMPGVEMPKTVLDELDRIKSDMEDITGQHAVSQGSAPGNGVVAATAIGFLQEKDDQLRSTGYASVEGMWEKMAKQTLSLFADYVDIPRAIAIVGRDKALNVVQLKGADIQNGLDIRVEAGSMLPTSKAAKQQFLMDLVNNGIISRDEFLSLLDYGGVDTLYNKIRVNEDEAQRENLRFKNLSDEQIMQYQAMVDQQALTGQLWEPDPQTGMPLGPPAIIPVQSWQNHQVHIIVHNDYRKTSDFEMLPEQIKQLMEMHVQQHTLALQTNMMSQGMLGEGQDPNALLGSPEQPALPPGAPGADPSMQGAMQ